MLVLLNANNGFVLSAATRTNKKNTTNTETERWRKGGSGRHEAGHIKIIFLNVKWPSDVFFFCVIRSPCDSI